MFLGLQGCCDEESSGDGSSQSGGGFSVFPPGPCSQICLDGEGTPLRWEVECPWKPEHPDAVEACGLVDQPFTVHNTGQSASPISCTWGGVFRLEVDHYATMANPELVPCEPTETPWCTFGVQQYTTDNNSRFWWLALRYRVRAIGGFQPIVHQLWWTNVVIVGGGVSCFDEMKKFFPEDFSPSNRVGGNGMFFREGYVTANAAE